MSQSVRAKRERRHYAYQILPRISPKDLRRVGTTFGLSTDCGPGEPEQVYVSRDLNDQDKRPVIVDGHVGYSLDMRMKLTEAQAIGLAKLLIDAVTNSKGRVNTP